MRAADLQPKQRILHPTTQQPVVVERVRPMVGRVRVYFKHYGGRGSFDSKPDTEIKEPPT